MYVRKRKRLTNNEDGGDRQATGYKNTGPGNTSQGKSMQEVYQSFQMGVSEKERNKFQSANARQNVHTPQSNRNSGQFAGTQRYDSGKRDSGYKAPLKRQNQTSGNQDSFFSGRSMENRGYNSGNRNSSGGNSNPSERWNYNPGGGSSYSTGYNQGPNSGSGMGMDDWNKWGDERGRNQPFSNSRPMGPESQGADYPYGPPSGPSEPFQNSPFQRGNTFNSGQAQGGNSFTGGQSRGGNMGYSNQGSDVNQSWSGDGSNYQRNQQGNFNASSGDNQQGSMTNDLTFDMYRRSTGPYDAQQGQSSAYDRNAQRTEFFPSDGFNSVGNKYSNERKRNNEAPGKQNERQKRNPPFSKPKEDQRQMNKKSRGFQQQPTSDEKNWALGIFKKLLEKQKGPEEPPQESYDYQHKSNQRTGMDPPMPGGPFNTNSEDPGVAIDAWRRSDTYGNRDRMWNQPAPQQSPMEEAGRYSISGMPPMEFPNNMGGNQMPGMPGPFLPNNPPYGNMQGGPMMNPPVMQPPFGFPPQPYVNEFPPQPYVNEFPPQPYVNEFPPQPYFNEFPPQPYVNEFPPHPNVNQRKRRVRSQSQGKKGADKGPASKRMKSNVFTRLGAPAKTNKSVLSRLGPKPNTKSGKVASRLGPVPKKGAKKKKQQGQEVNKDSKGEKNINKKSIKAKADRFPDITKVSLHCKACKISKFQNVYSYLLHLHDKTHNGIYNTYFEKMQAVLALIKVDAEVVLGDRGVYFDTPKPKNLCTVCSLPSKLHNKGLKACDRYHDYIMLGGCCQSRKPHEPQTYQKPHEPQSYWRHTHSVSHLWNEYKAKVKYENKLNNNKSTLSVVKDSFAMGKDTFASSTEDHWDKVFFNYNLASQAVAYEQFGSYPIPMVIENLLQSYEGKEQFEIGRNSLYRPRSIEYAFYDPSSSYGKDKIIFETNFYCLFCKQIMGDTKESVIEHCSSRKHYDALKKTQDHLRRKAALKSEVKQETTKGDESDVKSDVKQDPTEKDVKAEETVTANLEVKEEEDEEESMNFGTDIDFTKIDERALHDMIYGDDMDEEEEEEEAVEDVVCEEGKPQVEERVQDPASEGDVTMEEGKIPGDADTHEDKPEVSKSKASIEVPEVCEADDDKPAVDDVCEGESEIKSVTKEDKAELPAGSPDDGEEVMDVAGEPPVMKEDTVEDEENAVEDEESVVEDEVPIEDAIHVDNATEPVAEVADDDDENDIAVIDDDEDEDVVDKEEGKATVGTAQEQHVGELLDDDDDEESRGEPSVEDLTQDDSEDAAVEDLTQDDDNDSEEEVAEGSAGEDLNPQGFLGTVALEGDAQAAAVGNVTCEDKTEVPVIENIEFGDGFEASTAGGAMYEGYAEPTLENVGHEGYAPQNTAYEVVDIDDDDDEEEEEDDEEEEEEEEEDDEDGEDYL